MAKVKSESRTCFGIDWYDSVEEADRIGAAVTASGQTYNGGFQHGRPCGRDATWDRLRVPMEERVAPRQWHRWYAVTTA